MDTQVKKIQTKICLKSLNFEYLYLHKYSRILFKAFFLRLRAIRDLFQVLDVENKLSLSSEEKLVLLLNTRNIDSFVINNVSVIKKKFGGGYNSCFFNLYVYSFLSLFDLISLPLLSVRRNRFTLSSEYFLDFDYFSKLFDSLVFYSGSLESSFHWQSKLNFVSLKSKFWLLRNIPFNSDYVYFLLQCTCFFDFKNFSISESNPLKANFFCHLYNFIIVDLVRVSMSGNLLISSY